MRPRPAGAGRGLGAGRCRSRGSGADTPKEKLRVKEAGQGEASAAERACWSVPLTPLGTKHGKQDTGRRRTTLHLHLIAPSVPVDVERISTEKPGSENQTTAAPLPWPARRRNRANRPRHLPAGRTGSLAPLPQSRRRVHQVLAGWIEGQEDGKKSQGEADSPASRSASSTSSGTP